jgi:hypothetical protein
LKLAVIKDEIIREKVKESIARAFTAKNMKYIHSLVYDEPGVPSTSNDASLDKEQVQKLDPFNIRILD